MENNGLDVGTGAAVGTVGLPDGDVPSGGGNARRRGRPKGARNKHPRKPRTASGGEPCPGRIGGGGVMYRSVSEISREAADDDEEGGRGDGERDDGD
eukprot:1612815-Rhodomonas_salina.1